MALNAPEVAVIGGGTGSFTILQELKEFTPNISAIVNMSDDGGSTGRLRDELGVLPPGDVRQCLVALSRLPEARDLFSYRFNEGSLAGQSLGNVILSGLELRYDSFQKAIGVASSILNIEGSVIPVTTDKHSLILRDGEVVIKGEHLIGMQKLNHRNAVVELDPEANINPDAQKAIEQSDLVVIAPGNLYGSLLPALAVNGMAESLHKTKATKVSISNLVTKPGQTDGWHVVDYIKEFERYIGEGQIDVVLFNNEHPSSELLKKYAADGEYPVGTSRDRFSELNIRALGAPLVSQEVATQDPSDTTIRRTLIRHDAHMVGRQLMRVFYER